MLSWLHADACLAKNDPWLPRITQHTARVYAAFHKSLFNQMYKAFLAVPTWTGGMMQWEQTSRAMDGLGSFSLVWSHWQAAYQSAVGAEWMHFWDSSHRLPASERCHIYLHLKGATFLHTRIVWGLLTASWWVESAVEPGRAGSLGSLSSSTHPREVSRARFPCWPTGVPDKGSAHAWEGPGLYVLSKTASASAAVQHSLTLHLTCSVILVSSCCTVWTKQEVRNSLKMWVNSWSVTLSCSVNEDAPHVFHWEHREMTFWLSS